ncbi:MAG: proline dehydrogenase family protein [Planctomycetes bacterium]|nr:proline dehydrogenase family protein [Planctomycetota bacterium]MBU4398480.1 proline dehydrogenase family protein [Planctomycetota bacterium]MCG2682886.1 proline dehydrogenase family protein [Planctomycetales bacterium]
MAWLGRGKQKTPTTQPQTKTPRPASPSPEVERRATEIGRELLKMARDYKAGVFSARFWSDQLMNWSMKDPAFKIQLFRFIDVFPMLRTPALVHDYLTDYLSQPGVTLPPGMDLGLKAGGLAKGIMAKTISGRITAMAQNFMAGVDAASALPALKKQWKEGVAFSVDLLGEACVSDEEARAYQGRYLDLVEMLPGMVAQWPSNPLLENDHLGPIPRTNVSIKISSLCARTDPIDFQRSLRALIEGLRPILEKAAKNNVLVNFDIEQFAIKDLTLSLFERCCEEIDFPAGLALQSYLRSGDEDARRIIDWSKRTGRQVTIRLIKGAYWDYESINAERMGWPVPVWTDKRLTDACFERMAERLVDAIPERPGQGGVTLALGSHNIRSIAYTLALIERRGLPQSALEVQKLSGMADQLRAALSGRGLRIREYTPVGEMIPGMAYFVRRLLENTSNQSWLRAGFSDEVSDDVLLASPQVAVTEKPGHTTGAAAARRHNLTPAVEGLGDGLPMVNESMRDFSQTDQRDGFAQAVAATKVPSIDRVPGAEEAGKAIAAAHAAFPAWRDRDPIQRSRMLIEAAKLMRGRRDELSSIMIREAGKPWREADADTCEAIDFCEFYARDAVRLFQPQRLGVFVGELDELWHQPRGVVSVISPWNFPLAICCGMTVAALSVGNTTIVKPSTQTRGVARAMCEILWQAGVPRDVLQFLPGSGREVGDILVRDPRVAMIAFTGSKEVGLNILAAAGQTPEGQPFVKKVVCEMGGKNAIIIDDSADLDEAVLGVRKSAFGYCGQKCSACSRAIVLDGVHDQFLKRLIESTRTLIIGDPADPATDFGPVIDEGAAAKIREYIEIGKSEGKLELACEVPKGLAERVGMPYVAPHIFSGIRREHRLANEEIFGPVLAVMRVGSFQEALEVANSTVYKLTGAVFSRKPSHLELARREFRVGNLYLNQGSTGALVGRQPFGGFGLSGVGSKAGGSDYLLHFTEPRSCSENTMRRGFAPGLEE